MAGEFDFSDFVAGLKGASLQEQAGRVKEELGRMSELVVREPGRKFQQQMYIRRLERLGRFLAGEDVTGELTPSELQAYVRLLDKELQLARAAQPAQAAAAAGPQLAAAERPGQEASLSGAERRQARRIYLKTRARIRRDAGGRVEVLEPLNVSRGGMSFQSAERYDLHETLWTTMHYQPGSEELETRSLVVRAAPLPDGRLFSYGVKFLPE